MDLCIFNCDFECPNAFQGIFGCIILIRLDFLNTRNISIFLERKIYLKWKRQAVSDRASQITHAYKYDYNHNLPILSANESRREENSEHSV